MILRARRAYESVLARLERALDRARWRLAWLTPFRMTVAVVLLVNLVLLGGYLWSRGGQTTHVRVEVRGNEYAGYVDGNLKSHAQFTGASGQGGIALSLEETIDLPSMPDPKGIDWVRVTDLDTGALLFEDDFSTGYERHWTKVTGLHHIDHGVVGIRGDGTIFLANSEWRNYAVDVSYKNIIGVAVLVHAQDPTTGVVFATRPFRQHDSQLAVLEEGNVVAGAPGGQVDPPRSEAIKSMVAMVLRPYPLIFVLLSAGFLAVLVLQFIPVPGIRLPDSRWLNGLPWLAAGAIAAGAFGVALFLMDHYIQRMPHVQDSVAYVFQAKMFAAGRLFAPAPPVKDVFDYELPQFITVSHGRWASVYPFGHPLALAIGARLGAMWIVPPLLGGASVVLTYAIGRKAYGARVGLLAALLLASSPFYFMTASEFMSHNTVTFYMLTSLFFMIVMERRPLLYSVLAGLFFGLAFNSRQLESTALIVPYGLFLLSQSNPASDRKRATLQVAGFAAGSLAMLAAYFLYNYITRGNPLTTGFTVAGFQTEVGFGGQHSVTMGIRNEQTQMVFFLLVLNGWPKYIGLMFVLLPFALGSRRLWDWFFLTSAVVLIGVYTLFIGHGIMYGPRYWYPAAPFLMLLAARGADRAGVVIAEAAAYVRSAVTGNRTPARWAGVLAVYLLVFALIGSSISSWLLSRRTNWFGDFVPQNAINLQGFNRADNRLIKLIDEGHLKNALVLVEQCPIWECYGSVFWLNTPTLDGNIVIAKDVPERRAELLAAYPDRSVYVASFGDEFLIPYGSPRPTPGATPPSQRPQPTAPRARDIPTPTIVPTPTPDVAAVGSRDQQRRNDLAILAADLQLYRERFGAYPIATGVQSFCRYIDGDAGCKVLAVVATIPTEPLGGDYYYLSDGRTYYLFASMESATDSSQCPAPPLASFANVEHLYCVKGGP